MKIVENKTYGQKGTKETKTVANSYTKVYCEVVPQIRLPWILEAQALLSFSLKLKIIIIAKILTYAKYSSHIIY